MKFTVVSPSKAFLSDYTDDELTSLRRELTYTNTGVQHLIKRHYANFFWKQRNIASWQLHLDGLLKDLKKCLVFEDGDKLYIRPGSIPHLTGFDFQMENLIRYPEPKRIPWLRPLPFELHPEQNTTWEGLVRDKHAHASLCTGFGKSAIILKTCRETGLNTVIVAPGKGIFEELVEKFEYHFGKKYVGVFGDGKKRLGKKFTIAIGDSLSNVKPGTPEWDFFSTRDVMIVDESHEFAAESLEEVGHGVLSDVPYRFFLSATQMRNDGTGPLLQSIIGNSVCDLSTEEAIKKGYICNHDFRIVSIESSNPTFESSDALAMKRTHFLNNRNIAQFIAKLANGVVLSQGKQTLVLCEELKQLSMLAPLLTVPYALAHSEKNAARLAEMGLEKVDVSESIEKFNKNEVKVLIGTGCIHVGRNIFPTHNTFNWVGGASRIKTKQGSIGRSVRHGHSNPWAAKCVPKEKATIWDFDIEGVFTMSRHLESRMECYKESGTEIKYIRLKA
jgi:superfamily II DNA or RNA helicase